MIKNLESLKERLIISEVIGNYIPLKKRGANFSAICPFHADSKPSLQVSDSKGIYHCFACGAGGDALSFVQEYKKVGFVEAVQEVAELIGFVLESDGEGAPKRDFTPLEYAKNCYKANKGEAMGFYRSRGIKDEFIERFELGFGVKLKEVKEEQSKEFGFRNFLGRAVFPIKSHTGRVLGFGARSLERNPKIKYINSPTSAAFNKSALLYGIDVAKKAIIKSKEAIICEGYIDVIMAHQAGLDNAVGTLGTALTKEHLAQLAKFGAKVVLCFDRDKAGRKATFRAINLLLQNRFFESEVMEIKSECKDLAEIVQKGEEEALKSAKRVSIIRYFLEAFLKNFSTLSIELRNKKIEELKGFFAVLSEPYLREEYKKWIEEHYGIGREFLEQKAQAPLLQQPYDPLEARVLKIMMENSRAIDYVLEYLDVEDLKSVRKPFYALLDGKECKELREVSFIETPKVEIEEAVRILYKKKLLRELEKIRDSKELALEDKLVQLTRIRRTLKRVHENRLEALAQGL
ncbi:MAG: DNA primase [Wolinella sp.]